MCVCVCVCVRERERETERENFGWDERCVAVDVEFVINTMNNPVILVGVRTTYSRHVTELSPFLSPSPFPAPPSPPPPPPPPHPPKPHVAKAYKGAHSFAFVSSKTWDVFHGNLPQDSCKLLGSRQRFSILPRSLNVFMQQAPATGGKATDDVDGFAHGSQLFPWIKTARLL